MNQLDKLEEFSNTIKDMGMNGVYVDPDIPQKKLKNAKRTHEIEDSEIIFILRDLTFFGSATESMLVSDEGLSFVLDDNKPPIKVTWGAIQDVVYKNDEKFYFYFDTNKSHFFKVEKESFFNPSIDQISIIVSKILEIASNFDCDDYSLYKSLVELYEGEAFDEFLELFDSSNEKMNEKNKFYKDLIFIRGHIHYRKGDLEKAISDFEVAKSSIPVGSVEFPYSFFAELMISKALQKTDPYKSLELLFGLQAKPSKDNLIDLLNIKVKDLFDPFFPYRFLGKTLMDFISLNKEEKIAEDIKVYIGGEIENSYNEYRNQFLNIPADKRRFVFVGDSNIQFASKFLHLNRKNLPNIKFLPLGYAQDGHLYTIHPYKGNIYLPVNDLDVLLEQDRNDEFFYFLQCLGATEIRIETVNSQNNFVQEDRKINVDSKISSGTGQSLNNKVKKENSSKSISGLHRKYNKFQKFKPAKFPFLPKDLVWFEHEPSWQRLYAQRMNGGILEHQESLKSTKNEFFKQSELIDVVNEVDAVYKTKFKVNFNKNSTQLNSSLDSKEFVVHVLFAPLDDLKIYMNEDISNQNQENNLNDAQFNDSELELLELFEEAFTDSSLSQSELNLLERFWTRKGISSKRAMDLLEIVKQRHLFTDSEMEYLDEYKFALSNDGKISEDERSLLKRMIAKLGISPERAKELEMIILQNE